MSSLAGKLTKTFAMAALGFACGGVLGAVTFDPFGDMLWLPDVHNTMNPDIQATMAMFDDKLAWVKELIGTQGGDGFMQTDMWQSLIEPYKQKLVLPNTDMDSMLNALPIPTDM